MATSDALKYRTDSLKVEASSVGDPEKKKELLVKADDFSAQSEKIKEEADVLVADANKTQYEKNDLELNTLITSSGNNSPDLDMASLYHDESKRFFKEAEKERASGNPEEALLLEKKAITKQEQSIELYKKAGGTLVSNTPPETVVVKPDSVVQPETVVVKPDSVVQPETVVVKPDSVVQPETVVVQPETNDAVKTSPEYKMYLSYTVKAGTFYKESQADYDAAAELKTISEKQFAESQSLIEQTAKTTDPDEQLKLLKKSEELDALSLKNRKACDSLTTTAKDKARSGKNEEDASKQYLLGVEPKLQEEIIVSAPKLERPAPVVKTCPAKSRYIGR